MRKISDEILADWNKYKKEYPTHTFLQFIEFMTGVELANVILTHIPKSAYESFIAEEHTKL